MPNKNYERGRASEYKAQRDLEALGYQTTRTAGSHGAADVIAWNEEGYRFIQCKTTTGKVSTSPQNTYGQDMEKLASLKMPPHSTAELWVRKIGQAGWAHRAVVRISNCSTRCPNCTSPRTQDTEASTTHGPTSD